MRAEFRVAAFAAVVLAGCVPMTPPQSPYTPTYAYTAPSSTGGQGISLALVNPKLSSAATVTVTNEYAQMGQTPPADLITADHAYSAFVGAINRGLNEYFTASGFTVSGPFKTIDEMTFPEKKQADLLLSIELSAIMNQPPVYQTPSQYSGTLFQSAGDCVFSGTIDLVLTEPLSMQRMWAKSIEVPARQGPCAFNVRGSADQFNTLMGNAQAKLYEQAFPDIMKTAERYFTPEEVALVKQQAQELRDKKVY
jgi:hypothetical protein